ncbi:MAG: hypothetical protein C3F11_22010 [Methylocystaceae bacterium]|nr:MAG: hypothetical protein C3F11_22010 [Methylocystaceae bacterium]
MTVAATKTRRAEDRHAWAFSGFPVWAAIAVALAAAIFLTLPRAALVWSAGEFFDSDDAMRAVQMRDLLAGQSWFDMTATRVDPPDGLFMHWSRIVDAPLAAADFLLRFFLSPERAERATRLIFPFACLAALFALAAWNARILGGEAIRIPSIWLVLLSAPMFVQFAPGRIDHHAPQIVLLMATLGLFNLGLDREKPRAMAFAASAMALSLAISLENLPFFVVLLATLLLLFIREDARERLAWFGLGAIVSFPLCFAATVAPSRYGVSTCDAFSAAHLAAALVGAVALVTLAFVAPHLARRSTRLFAAAFAATAVLAAVVFVAPHCLGDPLGGLDPLLRDLWLSHVAEAKPLSAFVDDAETLLSTATPVILGLIAALVAASKRQDHGDRVKDGNLRPHAEEAPQEPSRSTRANARGRRMKVSSSFETRPPAAPQDEETFSPSLLPEGTARWRFAVTAAAILIGLATASWQIRAFSSVTPLAMAPLACAAVAMARRLAGDGYSSLFRGALTAVLCLAVSPIGLALALHSDREAPHDAPRACLEARAFAPLAALPAARIAAPIDIGAHLLAFTPHAVFAAPYHRDNHGNRIVVDAFLAPPTDAERILRAARAGLALWCADGKMGSELVERSPSGLAAALARGEAPSWLEKIPLEGTPFHVFALRPAP